MSSVIHIAEIAALLAVAYVVGWAIGYLLHRLVARPTKTADAIPAERIAAVTGDNADALVKAPIIFPVASDAPPPPSQLVVEPSPAVAETSAVAPESAPVAPESIALPPVRIPAIVAPPDLFPRPVLATVPAAEPAPIEPEFRAELESDSSPAAHAPAVPTPYVPPPVEPAAAPAPATAAPAIRPGEAWSGEIRGRAPTHFEPAAPEPAPVPEPVAAPVPAAPPPPPVADYDEDAAMRAIEGGWSRTRARAMPNAPELHDVGVAVAAATAAVEQMLASVNSEVAPEVGGKPLGLVRPRIGGKDDLKQIVGLGGLDESTLNNLGVYHFDQIAAWSEAEVLWMENHVFARGRIGHENWQAQARQLAAAVA